MFMLRPRSWISSNTSYIKYEVVKQNNYLIDNFILLEILLLWYFYVIRQYCTISFRQPKKSYIKLG